MLFHQTTLCVKVDHHHTCDQSAACWPWPWPLADRCLSYRWDPLVIVTNFLNNMHKTIRWTSYSAVLSQKSLSEKWKIRRVVGQFRVRCCAHSLFRKSLAMISSYSLDSQTAVIAASSKICASFSFLETSIIDSLVYLPQYCAGFAHYISPITISPPLRRIEIISNRLC